MARELLLFIPRTAHSALAKMHIDEHGNVLENRVTNVSDAPEFFVERIKEQVQRMEFMPGYFEGKPVPMFYVEPVFD
jgi:hypothetical protein